MPNQAKTSVTTLDGQRPFCWAHDNNFFSLCEYFRAVGGGDEEELNLVSKVGTLNMKMLDHLLEIRDNPVRAQLLGASAGFAACFVARVFCSRTLSHKHTHIVAQKDGWSPTLATFLLLASRHCHALHHLDAAVRRKMPCLFHPVYLQDSVFYFSFFMAVVPSLCP